MDWGWWWATGKDWLNRIFLIAPEGERDTEHVERYEERRQVRNADFGLSGESLALIAKAGGGVSTDLEHRLIRREYRNLTAGQMIDLLDNFKEQVMREPRVTDREIERICQTVVETGLDYSFTEEDIEYELTRRLVEDEEERLGLNRLYRRFDIDTGAHTYRFEIPTTDAFETTAVSEDEEFPVSQDMTFESKEVEARRLGVGFDLLSRRTVRSQVRSWTNEKARLIESPSRVDISDEFDSFADMIYESLYQLKSSNYHPDVVIVPSQLREAVSRDDNVLRLSESESRLTVAGMDIVFDDTGRLNGTVIVGDSSHAGYECEFEGLQTNNTGLPRTHRYASTWYGNYVDIQDDAYVVVDPSKTFDRKT